MSLELKPRNRPPWHAHFASLYVESLPTCSPLRTLEEETHGCQPSTRQKQGGRSAFKPAPSAAFSVSKADQSLPDPATAESKARELPVIRRGALHHLNPPNKVLRSLNGAMLLLAGRPGVAISLRGTRPSRLDNLWNPLRPPSGVNSHLETLKRFSHAGAIRHSSRGS